MKFISNKITRLQVLHIYPLERARDGMISAAALRRSNPQISTLHMYVVQSHAWGQGGGERGRTHAHAPRGAIQKDIISSPR